MADVVYSADLDTKGVRRGVNDIKGMFGELESRGVKSFTNIGKSGGQQIRQLGFAMQRFGIGGAAAWGEIFAAAGVAGIAIGAVIISVLALQKAFKVMADIAVKAFKQVTKIGVEAAKEYEIAGAQFTAVMKGNEKAAEATLERVKTLSREVGQNLTGVARAFLPEVESLDQLEQVLKIAAALARFQPEQGETGARIALQEFLSGETRSLRRRFEIPQEDIDRFKDAFEFGGIGAALEELDGYLERTGRSLDDLADTADVAWNRMKEGFRQLAAVYGEPIIDAAKEQLNALNETTAAIRPNLEAVANVFGEVVGKLVDIVGTQVDDFLKNLDIDTLYELGLQLKIAAEAFGLLIEQMGIGQGAAGNVNSVVYSLTGAVIRLQGALLNMAYWVSQNTAKFYELADAQATAFSLFAKVAGGINKLANVELPITGAKPFDFGPVGEIANIFEGIVQLQADIAEGVADITINTRDWEQAYTDYAQTVADFYVDYAKYLAGVEEGTDAGEEEANAILERDRALEKLNANLSEAAELEEKIAEERGKFTAQANEKMAQIDLRFARAELDAEERRTRRREDIEEGFLDKMEDLRTDYNDKFAKLQRDLLYDEQDAVRKHGRKVIEIEEDLARERQEAEIDFRRKLAEIRRKFDFDAQEAIRANDAIEYLRIRRREEFELNEARIKRDEDIEDANAAAQERRAALQRTLEQELEDVRIANRRKIDELNFWLDEQTAAANLWAEREREQANKRYERDLEDAQEARRRNLEDYNTWWQKMDEETEKGVADMVARLEDLERQISEIVARFPDLTSQLFGGVGRISGAAAIARSRGSRGFARRGESGGTSTNTASQVQELRSLAVRYGLRAGYSIGDIQNTVRNMDVKQLQDYIRQIQSELRVGGRQKGGPVRGAEPVLVGEPLPGGKPNPEIFLPAQDGFIVPVKLLADKTGKTPTSLVSTISRVLSSSSKEDKTQELIKEIGMDGRQYGGPVYAGDRVIVGEPLDGDTANPELYLPADKLHILGNLERSTEGVATVISAGLSGLIEPKTGTREAPYKLIEDKETAGKEEVLGQEQAPDIGSPVFENLRGDDGASKDDDQPKIDIESPVFQDLTGEQKREVEESIRRGDIDIGSPVFENLRGDDAGRREGGKRETGRLFGEGRLFGRRRNDPQLVGLSKDGAPQQEMFLPPSDGIIVPIKQIAQHVNLPPGKIIKIIKQVIHSGSRDKVGLLGRRLGIEGRQLGGPVQKGKPVFVGEPLPGNQANPELFLPSLKKFGDGDARRVLGEAAGKREAAQAAERHAILTKRSLEESVRRVQVDSFVAGAMVAAAPSYEVPMPTASGTVRMGAPAGFYGVGAGSDGEGIFPGAELSLRHTYYSPPFIRPGGDTISTDNSRTIEINQPELNPGLTPMEVTQVKEIFAQMRLEELLT